MTRRPRALSHTLLPLLLLLLLLAGGGGGAATTTTMRAAEQSHKPAAAVPEAGVPRDLARQRAAHYTNVRYALDLDLEPGAEMLRGTLQINVTLDATAGELVLDWRVVKKDVEPQSRISHLSVNGRPVNDARFARDHLIIPRAYLKTGENVLQMNFESPISASGSAVTRYRDREDNSEYIYTLFVPSDASTAFPCFDQPDLKARFTLTVAAPKSWKVITNTAPDGAGRTQGGRESLTVTSFRETAPISTYVFAFAAGPFTEFDEREGMPAESMTAYPPVKSVAELSKLIENAAPPLRLFVRKSKAERARLELAEVFRLNREALGFFARYFDYKFPFPKYDLVVLPEFAYGGMEHAGATFLREESILFPSDPTANDLAARAELILHEAAHQWFGDLVTMRWFDDLWLKEGFATFMAYKAIEALMPQLDAWKVFHLRTKPLAYLTDASRGTTPIFQEIPNLSAAKSAYGNIVYRKAPSMLRQAEFYLGAPAFQRAVRAVVKEHAFGNAEWNDLVRAFERTSGQKLDAWADAWVKRRGMPDVRVSWTADGRGGRINRFILEQRDVLGEGGSWPMRMKILLASDEGAPDETLTVKINGGGARQIRRALGRRRPAYVFANYEDYGYGRFLLDEKSRDYVVRHLGSVKDGFLRALLWGSLWESVREAELAPSDYIELGIRLAAGEHDEVTLQPILARVQTAFTRYLSEEQRRTIAPRLEQMIYERIMGAGTAGLRITYFRTYREIASTPAALDNLVRVLDGELRVPGMTLRSRDHFDIIRALVAARAARSRALLEKQSAADLSDDAKRYSYAAAAAEPRAEVKRKYFGAYLSDAELAESWIEASLNPFNAPEQAALTLPYLDAALRELPKLKRTRKIFFVNGWLAAFIGGQCSDEALQIVDDFLRREGSLDRDLRLKVLEAADGLGRCVRIRRKFAGESHP